MDRRSAAMHKLLLPVAALVLAGATAADAQRTPTSDRVRCSLNYAPDRACMMTDRVVGDTHRMAFVAGNTRVTFVGRKQTGWWAGRLNGKPAMGYERNRGNIVFSSYDLSTSFSWWYPANAHGNY